jgi:hypothetical protein
MGFVLPSDPRNDQKILSENILLPGAKCTGDGEM